jgi:chorismate-pyruvate lyase
MPQNSPRLTTKNSKLPGKTIQKLVGNGGAMTAVLYLASNQVSCECSEQKIHALMRRKWGFSGTVSDADADAWVGGTFPKSSRK